MAEGDARRTAILRWLRETLELPVESLVPASSDASFRRYFRILIDGTSMIVMDAPPDREDVRPFLHVARLLRDAGVAVPEVYNQDITQGFLLLSDLGSVCYLQQLDNRTVDRLYGHALEALLRLQTGVRVQGSGLPPYDEALLVGEMELFRHWFLGGLLNLELSPGESALLDEVWGLLVTSALEQPRVCVHRDYHSRNLMVGVERCPGVLDFQDAVVGPVTYDLVSLLRDCYIAWPQEQVEVWVSDYFQMLRRAGLVAESDGARFLRWFDWMGLQRHLKAIGIFSRLKLRDGKSGYINDIPRTMGYVSAVCGRYPELRRFGDFLRAEVLPVEGLET